jgi:hypothetical protein
MKYLRNIGIHRMFLDVATFSVTNRSISSTKKKIDLFKHFFWPPSRNTDFSFV